MANDRENSFPTEAPDRLVRRWARSSLRPPTAFRLYFQTVRLALLTCRAQPRNGVGLVPRTRQGPGQKRERSTVCPRRTRAARCLYPPGRGRHRDSRWLLALSTPARSCPSRRIATLCGGSETSLSPAPLRTE